MKECWINVYYYPKSGHHQSHRMINENDACMMAKIEYNLNRRCIYRIHVKLDGGYNKRKPKYEKYTHRDDAVFYGYDLKNMM